MIILLKFILLHDDYYEMKKIFFMSYKKLLFVSLSELGKNTQSMFLHICKR